MLEVIMNYRWNRSVQRSTPLRNSTRAWYTYPYQVHCITPIWTWYTLMHCIIVLRVLIPLDIVVTVYLSCWPLRAYITWVSQKIQTGVFHKKTGKAINSIFLCEELNICGCGRDLISSENVVNIMVVYSYGKHFELFLRIFSVPNKLNWTKG